MYLQHKCIVIRQNIQLHYYNMWQKDCCVKAIQCHLVSQSTVKTLNSMWTVSQHDQKLFKSRYFHKLTKTQSVYIQSVSGQQNVIKIGHHQQVSSVDSILQRGLLSAADHLSISPTMQFTHHQLHSLSSLESWTTLAGDQSLLLYWTHKFTRAADFND